MHNLNYIFYFRYNLMKMKRAYFKCLEFDAELLNGRICFIYGKCADFRSSRGWFRESFVYKISTVFSCTHPTSFFNWKISSFKNFCFGVESLSLELTVTANSESFRACANWPSSFCFTLGLMVASTS